MKCLEKENKQIQRCVGMKKILYISNIAGSKASVNFFGTALRAAKRLGMDFYVVANRSASTKEQIEVDEKEYGVHLLHADISRSPLSLSNIKAYKQICEIIRKYDINYIHCNTPVGGVLGRLAGKKCKVKKVLYQAHGFHFYKGAPKKNGLIYYTIEKLLARFTDCIVTMNAEDNAAAKRFKCRNNGPVYNVHGVGIDLSMYEGLEQHRESKRQELGFIKSDIVLISMGDLVVRKNYKVALEAIAKCNNSKLQYLVCGRGEELDNLKTLAKELNIEKQIHFLGYRTDVKELLSAADVFLFSTLQEGMPRSMMEAMAVGLPCIASKIRGNVDLLEDGKGGFLCDPYDSDVFAKAINKLINNKEMLSQMSKWNLEEIKKYDISVIEKEIIEIYNEVLS